MKHKESSQINSDDEEKEPQLIACQDKSYIELLIRTFLSKTSIMIIIVRCGIINQVYNDSRKRKIFLSGLISVQGECMRVLMGVRLQQWKGHP